MPELTFLEVGDECFTRTEELKLIALQKLERVVIGRFSFSDYSVCEIENVPSLEVIEMGELNEASRIFWYASLELKSDGDRMK